MWLPEDVDAALEWQSWKASLCSGCGQPKHECMSPDGPAYEATAIRCRACETRDRKANAWRDNDNAETAGLFFVVSEAEEG
jgi:hypothetical protein